MAGPLNPLTLHPSKKLAARAEIFLSFSSSSSAGSNKSANRKLRAHLPLKNFFRTFRNLRYKMAQVIINNFLHFAHLLD